MEKLLTEAFPVEEYRPLEQLRTYTDRTVSFHNNLIEDGGSDIPAGILTYWDFPRFRYIEHFAIRSSLRGKGYGTRTLEFLIRKWGLPVVVEVERPTESNAERRIGFYRRLGFLLWENDYHQPPYRPDGSSLPLYLMVHGNLTPEKDYEEIRHTLHTVVYGANE